MRYLIIFSLILAVFLIMLSSTVQPSAKVGIIDRFNQMKQSLKNLPRDAVQGIKYIIEQAKERKEQTQEEMKQEIKEKIKQEVDQQVQKQEEKLKNKILDSIKNQIQQGSSKIRKEFDKIKNFFEGFVKD